MSFYMRALEREKCDRHIGTTYNYFGARKFISWQRAKKTKQNFERWKIDDDLTMKQHKVGVRIGDARSQNGD